ncbi:fungal-specific transcription factor domain-containing protein [Phaeosphaeriaceae sp. PMI808]|nr:fungal-specific transcription factor domain-containing protein [Phaeosphaeriaceae sp. PMI808]
MALTKCACCVDTHLRLGTVHLSSPEAGDEESDEEHPLLEPFTQSDFPGNDYATSFKGPAHSDNFLRSVRKVSGVTADEAPLDVDPNFYAPGTLPLRRLSGHCNARLPPISILQRLLATQYRYIGTIFSFTEQEACDQLINEARKGPRDLADQNSCLLQAKLLVMLAFGKLYSINQWVDHCGPPGFEYFKCALQLLPDIYEEPSILFVETLALVGYFFQNMNRRDAAFLHIGTALRMAISLGLHQEVSLPGIDEITKERRRRVWWSIYSLDRILCVKSGNPITIQDEDIGALLPSRLPHEPEYCPAVVLKHYTKLSIVLGQIMTGIYRRAPKTGPRLVSSVQSIIMALSKWHDDLPVELRFDPTQPSISRESVSTLLHYYQCINMTARPLLFHVVQKRLQGGPAQKEKDWKTDLTPTTIKVIELCVSAAQDCINMMTIAAQRNLVATYGYMDSEHAFSATIVLVMVCVAFPTNTQNMLAMDAGLELLRTISQRGNIHMGARYELLDHIRSTLIPGDVPMLLAPEMGMEMVPALSMQVDSPVRQLANVAGSQGGAIPVTANLAFPVVDNTALINMFYGVDTNVMAGNEFWEEAFTNPTGDSTSDLWIWTQMASENMERSGMQ